MIAEPMAIEPWLTFAGPINNESVHRFFAAFQQVVQAGTARVHLLIQSAGGPVGDGIALYGYLRGLPIEIVTYNAGAVESIAVLPYLAGKVRRISQSATFLIHKTTFSNQPPLGAVHLSAMAEAARLYDANTERILRSEISLPDDRWAAHNVSDLVVSATDAIEYRLAHEIADFKPLHGRAFVQYLIHEEICEL